jgi:hypothetical protein
MLAEADLKAAFPDGTGKSGSERIVLPISHFNNIIAPSPGQYFSLVYPDGPNRYFAD